MVSHVLKVEVAVAYWQAYVLSGDARQLSMDDSFRGQANGLCGAATPGVLFLVTGLHSGRVPFEIAVAATEPPLQDEWEDVVEASFAALDDRLVLEGWAAGSVDHIPFESGLYRVRYCARGMDAGRKRDTRLPGHPVADHYLLQFWPGPFRQDAVVRLGSETAAYHHEYARNVPPPKDAEPSSEEKPTHALRERLNRSQGSSRPS